MRNMWHIRYISGACKKQNKNDYIVYYYNDYAYIKPTYNENHTKVLYYEAYLIVVVQHSKNLIGKYNKLERAKEACYSAV